MSDTTVTISTDLGWRADRRPRPGIARAVGAAGGAMAVLAIVVLTSWIDDSDPAAPGVLLTAALLAAALLVASRSHGPLRSAAMTAAAISVPLIWAFLLIIDRSPSHGDFTLFFLASMVTYGVLYAFVGVSRGDAVVLALLVLLFAGWIQFEASDANGPVPFQTEATSITEGNLGADTDTTAASVALLIGLGYLGIGAMADRRSKAGLATPFVVVGAIGAVIGAAVLGADDSPLGAGILAIIAGLVVGWIGSRGERRFTTWFGGVVVLGGTIAIVVDLAGTDDGAGAFVLAVAATAALLCLAMLLGRFTGESPDGDGAAPPPLTVLPLIAPPPMVPPPPAPTPTE